VVVERARISAELLDVRSVEPTKGLRLARNEQVKEPISMMSETIAGERTAVFSHARVWKNSLFFPESISG
jgi:hypothetical protein